MIGSVNISRKDGDFLNEIGKDFYIGFTDQEIIEACCVAFEKHVKESF